MFVYIIVLLPPLKAQAHSLVLQSLSRQINPEDIKQSVHVWYCITAASLLQLPITCL